MGRTALFSKLSRVFSRLDRTRRTGRSLARRDFLGLTALAARNVALPACGDEGEEPKPVEEPPRVVVVGAGLAGLHAAYRLKQATVIVTVYEATERVGG